jgi:succinate dehydrogenase / fumarate reductase cytochrome b subunit
MDATHAVTREFGHQSAVATLALSALLTLALGYKLFF